MGILQKKKVEELEQQEAAGAHADRPKNNKPVFHVHKDKEGNFVGGHFIEKMEVKANNPHLDSILERLQNRKDEQDK